jgi:ATP-dependent DNA ligase
VPAVVAQRPRVRWASLRTDIAARLLCSSAVIDGEIACLDASGKADFYSLLFRRAEPYFCAFDLLEIDGEDLRHLPLRERKRRLRAIIPRSSSCRPRYVDHVAGRGRHLFCAACAQDAEGIVAKWAEGTYQNGPGTSWLKIKNPTYSQMEGRHELFESRRPTFEGRGRRVAAVQLALV